MWMTVLGAGSGGGTGNILWLAVWTKVCAKNGKIWFANSTSGLGIAELDFISDSGFLYRNTGTVYGSYKGNIAQRNDGLGFRADRYSSIPNSLVNDVAATVLPGTPRNPLRLGLPTPTVAAATEGGVSIIYPDGRIASYTGSVDGTATWQTIEWYNNKLCMFKASNGRGYLVAPFYANSSGSINTLPGLELYTTNSITNNPFGISSALISAHTVIRGVPMSDDRIAKAVQGSLPGLDIVRRNSRMPTSSMVASITDKFNTGHMPGSTMRLALAESSADLADLIQAAMNDPLDYADNAAATAAGYTSIGADITFDGGKATFVNLDTSSVGDRTMNLPVPLVSGATYFYEVVTTDINVPAAGTLRLQINGLDISRSFATADNGSTITSRGVFIANSAIADFRVARQTNPGSGSALAIASIRLVRVAADRSIAGNNLIVNGTIQRSLVAAGADVAAYKGFSTTNYLELPYSSQFDFGAGDFVTKAWVRSTGGNQIYMYRGTPDTNQWGMMFFIDANGMLNFRLITTATTTLASTFKIDDGRWHLVALVRRGTTAREVWCDGIKQSFAGSALNISDAGGTAVFRIGRALNDGAALSEIALPRVSAYAPTDAQMRQMYEEEKALFEPNAKALLPSPNVQSLSYDEDTDELLAGTPNGTAIIKGVQVTDALRSTLGKNKVRNSEGTGATAGGTANASLPTGWTWNALPAPFTLTTLGTGRENGRAYVDMRIAGTNSTGAAVFPYLLPQAINTVPAAMGESWTVSFGVRIIAGSLTGINQVQVQVGGWNNLSASESNSTNITPTGTYQRYSHTRALNNANTNNVTGSMALIIPNAAVVDVTFRLYEPQLEKSVAATEYVPGLSANDNHKFVAAAAGIRVVASDNGVDAWQPSVALRKNLLKQGPRAPYDPNVVSGEAVTADATVTAISRISIPEGTSIGFTIDITAREYSNPAGDAARYVIQGIARRPVGGNVTVNATTTTVFETTSTMDCVAAAETASQALVVNVTGVAAKRLVWRTRTQLQDMAEAA